MTKLLRSLRNEDGIGLIEVLVALMIFSIISIGMAYSMISMTRLTADSTMRETATNLAAAEIDRIQSLPDAFAVYSGTRPPILVNGVPFTVRRSVAWVSTTGASGSCGSGGGNLQYKRVNVEVSWPDMYLNAPVRADSALAPDSRINDPSYGTVLVSVLGIDGTGRSGVTVRVTPESGGGGAAVSGTIDPTDSDGCTYVLKVSPGKYTIEVEHSGYVDSNQVEVPSYTEQVIVAGSTTTAAFQYEQASNFTLKFAATSTQDPDLPSNIETTYIGGLVNYVKSGSSTSIKLHPFPSGYQAVSGDPSACLNVDPENWAATSTMKAGVRAVAVATAPGGSANLPVPMGVFTVDVPNSNSQRYITAVQQSSSGGGNPGCATTKTYTWATRYSRDSTQTLALPYGTYKLYAGNSVGSTSNQLSSGITVLDGVIKLTSTGGLVGGILGGGGTSGSIMTLDPREPVT